MTPDCIKRQQEFRGGEERFRCLNPEAEHYRLPVLQAQCAVCPVAVLRKQEGPPCKQKQPHNAELHILEQHEGYPDCPYRYKGQHGLTCNITGLPVTPGICGRCDAETRTRTAGLVDKVGNYLFAIRQWVAQGCPNRTPEEIKNLYETHCLNCDRRDPETDSCKNCGCALSATTLEPLKNKLAMATEHCPLGRF